MDERYITNAEARFEGGNKDSDAAFTALAHSNAPAIAQAYLDAVKVLEKIASNWVDAREVARDFLEGKVSE